MKLAASWVCCLFLADLVLVEFGRCQMNNADLNNPLVRQWTTQIIYAQLSNLTLALNQQIKNHSNFCVKDPETDWNNAFNFSSNLDFVSSCLLSTGGDFTNRVCTAAEVKFYFDNLFKKTGGSNYMSPNRNCNLTSWNSGCEPGWGCRTDSDEVDLKDSMNIPARVTECQPCCQGFFCPHGLTCMIPCPLGSYCPLATLNNSTGVCEPYTYQLPPGQPNHTCGAANDWADFASSKELFCSPGSYCPTNIQRNTCDSGHYCRIGSTSEKPCFKLTTCDASTATQNIHAYGVMLIAALTTLLVIIYNCSDHVLTTRERRLAKSREKAAAKAREIVRARGKWKAAKNAAKKHATGIQKQFSKTFSRKKSFGESERSKILDEMGPAGDSDLYPPPHLSTSNPSEQSFSSARGQRKEPTDIFKRMHEFENDSYGLEGSQIFQYTYDQSFSSTRGQRKEHTDIVTLTHEIENDSFRPEGLSFESEDQTSKGKTPEIIDLHTRIPQSKDLHTRSQIFQYTYAQLEKEKVFQQQNKNLTFSGVIAMATDVNVQIKRRPAVEIAFRNLTLTLKGKKKHLLRCVTGKIKPGRITAVMGPSGAGKTTFLSALVGKKIGCTLTGSILVNGKNDSIHSYKKIIGFVPQDDIVHGNLTVEENLWFSARCRLSANLSKADKVLVVERVIESLGLQTIRDSLVGTVEKRGISGGQRKRVNVGLEMVIEPSLLILDEPTSGLDSSTSQLLLKALRREALEGVNICMVVHQPSFALFKMFDDLILLAKGGLTAYHGPVKKVEEYFAGLGIIVPERINPPDYFIDILEGLIKPNRDDTVSYSELPIRWMLHNGYPVPPDLKQSASLSSTKTIPTNSAQCFDDEREENSFAGELWQDMRCFVDLQQDNIRHNFLKVHDSSKRRTPGVFQQYKYYLGRVSKQRLREAKLQAVDYLILLLAGACLGSLTKGGDETFGALGYTYTVIAVSLLCQISALRSFSLDKLQYWRESASGMSSLAYFLSKDTTDHFNTLVKPVVYLSMFYFFSNPRSAFTDNYVVLLCLVYCVTGIGYVLAIFLHPGSAQLCSVLLPVVLTLISTKAKASNFLMIISKMCYARWALEAFVIANAERYSGVWLLTRCAALEKSGYDIRQWGFCIFVLMLAGVASRVIAYIGMVTLQKK